MTAVGKRSIFSRLSRSDKKSKEAVIEEEDDDNSEIQNSFSGWLTKKSKLVSVVQCCISRNLSSTQYLCQSPCDICRTCHHDSYKAGIDTCSRLLLCKLMLCLSIYHAETEAVLGQHSRQQAFILEMSRGTRGKKLCYSGRDRHGDQILEAIFTVIRSNLNCVRLHPLTNLSSCHTSSL